MYSDILKTNNYIEYVERKEKRINVQVDTSIQDIRICYSVRLGIINRGSGVTNVNHSVGQKHRFSKH